MSRLRRFGKRLFVPVARPILTRIDQRIEPLRQEVDGLSKQVRLLTDTVSSQTAAVHETRSALEDGMRNERARIEDEMEALRERLEFTRNEVMYEVRYGGRGPGGAGTNDIVEPRIVAEERVQSSEEVRLNLGCGHVPLDGFLNVDSRELDRVDIVADVHHLPYSPGTVARIHSAHLLEHFPLEELRRSLLPYWTSLLRPGGLLTAVVPDAEAMIAEFSAGRMTFEELRLVTFGQQEYDKDFHFNMFSRTSIQALLEQAGLEDVRIVASGRRNGVCYEMEIEGRRPEGRPMVGPVADSATTGH
jgi:predicted SAM-dependent methyltransferase